MKAIQIIFLFFLNLNLTFGQVVIYSDSLISYEESGTTLCFNNTSLMAGSGINDRYLLYFNSDTIFLNVNQSGIWTRKTAHTGNNIKSATLTINNDTIWICWKESVNIKTSYSADKGDSWSSVLNVSPSGNVSAPSVYASNGKIHFVWFNESASDTTVLHNVYFNGAFLSVPNTLSSSGFKATWPSVTAIGDTVLCSWKESHVTSKIYFASSFSGGNTGSWTTSSFTNGPNTAKDPNLSYAYDINTNTHYVYLVYDGTNKIYFQRSTDLGASWSSPVVISNPAKNSQFAKVECNNSGFVGVSWEHRTVVSLFDDTKKDVGFAYSINWGASGSFGNDSLAYAHSPFGAPLASLNKIDENNFYLVWLSKDTVMNKNLIYERRVAFTSTTDINSTISQLPGFLVYPNPTTGNLIFECSDRLINNESIKIYNVFGKEILEIQLTGRILNINVSLLPDGIYFLQSTENGNGMQKIIIQKNE